MHSFAKIDLENKVVQVIIADSLIWIKERITGNWVQLEDSDRALVGIGYTYNPNDKTFTPPVVEEFVD
jgi:hypothetical protein